MNIAGSDPKWCLVYPDGRYCTDEEKHWSEVSVARVYGAETLYVSREAASQFSAIVRGKWHTLKAPVECDDVHFFRYYRSRKRLGGDTSDLLYHAIGYVGVFGKITLEIAPDGDTTLRFEPLLNHAR